MIVDATGDIFKSKATVLTNPVNSVGVMGAGLAKEFKRRWPESYKRYRSRCISDQIRPGHPYLDRNQTPYLLHFPTKENYWDRSRLEDIAFGLERTSALLDFWDITSIAIPALGCGLGGLDWEVVHDVIVEKLDREDRKIELYDPVR